MSTPIENLKKTPLCETHIQAGAKMVDFGGWYMPVQYTGILDEHQTVRQAVGLFDISHMGEVFVGGPEAEAWLDGMLTNNVSRLRVGECQYSFLLNEAGGVIDDLIVYRLADEEFLLVVNASKVEEDVAWLKSHLKEGVRFDDRSDAFAGLAVQGPNAIAVYEALFGESVSLPARSGVAAVDFPLDAESVQGWVARTGYTGEDGYEFFLPASGAVALWKKILEVGAPFGIKPAGLGARDTLRLEMCYPLNGNDLSPERSPLEAGLGFFVDLAKPHFIGREALVAQKEGGLKQRLVAFKMKEKSPPLRAHYPVVKEGAVIGELSSGSLSPSMGIGIGMAYLPAELAKLDEEIEVDIRGRRFTAVIQKKPLYRKSV